MSIPITREVVNFFQNQGFVVFSTIDANGFPHNSCKDIVKIEPNGRIYLLDAYRAKTFKNLGGNQNVSITAVDEHKFKGYSIKGRAKILDSDQMPQEVAKAWEDKVTSRMTRRLLKNIKGEKGHSLHPEAQLPKPQYMICIEAEEIINLTPIKLR
jgi:predicted pyridoxine 5'-phosphate oxidase superfamily flavin-nucleotide-binding protein